LSRGLDFAKDVFHVASRGAERILPPMALWFLLWQLNDALAARYAWLSRDRAPAPSLPRPVGSKPQLKGLPGERQLYRVKVG
jgi:hypothetical protein